MRTHFNLVVFVLVVILSLLLTACSGETASPTGTEPVSSTGTTTSPTATEEPADTEIDTSIPITEEPDIPPAVTTTPPPTPTTIIDDDFEPTLANHFGFMPAFLDFPGAIESGGAYDRPHFELFQWGMIEREPGLFDFFETDRYIREAQSYGMHILANIQPFARWDQEQCHQDLTPPDQPGDPRFVVTKGKPCDMEAYQEFVTGLVERYDGDGIDDMSGLTFPIKHWEVMNEPEFSTGDLIFFQGDAADYYDILKATYEAVKAADPDGFVVQGGMAGMMEIDIEFWQEVFDLGGADYLDIMNMHSIGHGEHLNIPAFLQFLKDYGIQGKPIWVTEVQYQQSHQTQNYTNEDFANILARSYIFALANGIDKLFYVNIKMPLLFGGGGPPFDERSALITDNGESSSLFYAHLTVAGILGELGTDYTVDIIRESVGEWFIEEGQYKFVIDGQTIYALWGSSSLPDEITGEVRVIDVIGGETLTDASSVSLTDSPIFIIVD